MSCGNLFLTLRGNHFEGISAIILDDNEYEFIPIRATSSSLAVNIYVSTPGEHTLKANKSGDIYNFRQIIIDGSISPAGSDRLLFDNTHNAKISNVVLRHSSNNGLQIINGSTGNDLKNITIGFAGKNGVDIQDAFQNFLYYVLIDTIGIHGISICGESYNNIFTYSGRDTSDLCNISDIKGNIKNTGENGIYLTEGAHGNTFTNCYIKKAGKSGIMLETEAYGNYFNQVVVIDPVLHGLHLKGDLVYSNRAVKISADHGEEWVLQDIYKGAGKYGILIEKGANLDFVGPKLVSDNKAGGIKLTDANTTGNFVGKWYKSFLDSPYDIKADPSLVYGNTGHGIHIAAGANHNRIEILNVAGNEGDGVLVEGEQTRGNYVSGIWTGYQYFPLCEEELPFDSPNTGNGITIKNGASSNIIGGTAVSRNNFTNDKKHGVLIDGPTTTHNHIQATDIGRSRKTKTIYIQQFSQRMLCRLSK